MLRSNDARSSPWLRLLYGPCAYRMRVSVAPAGPWQRVDGEIFLKRSLPSFARLLGPPERTVLSIRSGFDLFVCEEGDVKRAVEWVLIKSCFDGLEP
jgi:hypothetical protein